MMPRLPGKRLLQLLRAADSVRGDASFAHQRISAALSEIEEFRRDPNSRALPRAEHYAYRVRVEVAAENHNPHQLQALVTQMPELLFRDLEEGCFVAVAKENAALLAADWLSSTPIARRSDRVLREIHAAGHCLALGEPTACMLLLTRVMDFGARLVAKSLELPEDTVSDKGLGTVAMLIQETIRKLVNAGTCSRSAETFYNGLVTDIRAFARGDRNEIVHELIEYPAERAMRLLQLVIDFMNYLATSFDDFTNPKIVK